MMTEIVRSLWILIKATGPWLAVGLTVGAAAGLGLLLSTLARVIGSTLLWTDGFETIVDAQILWLEPGEGPALKMSDWKPRTGQV